MENQSLNDQVLSLLAQPSHDTTPEKQAEQIISLVHARLDNILTSVKSKEDAAIKDKYHPGIGMLEEEFHNGEISALKRVHSLVLWMQEGLANKANP